MTILDRIVADTRSLVAARKQRVPRSTLEECPAWTRAPQPLDAALHRDTLSIIAEIKRASPSRGLIRAAADVADLALQYDAAGASAISVLTEPTHFQGSLDDLLRARRATELPLLRKDFIIDEYQLFEARAYGADAVLLIAAVLDPHALRDLHQAAEALELSCLVELYDRSELDGIDLDEVRILGVNNRDLRTFEVDIDHSVRVLRDVPPGIVRVSESGLRTPDDLAHVRRHGIDAVLMGETLMRAPAPGDLLASLQAGVQALLDAPPPHPTY